MFLYRKTKPFSSLASSNVTDISVEGLWHNGETCDDWIKRFTATYLSVGCGCNVLELTTPVCSMDPSLCHLLCPYIVHSTLHHDAKGHAREQTSKLFKSLLKETEGRSSNNSSELRKVGILKFFLFNF